MSLTSSELELDTLSVVKLAFSNVTVRLAPNGDRVQRLAGSSGLQQRAARRVADESLEAGNDPCLTPLSYKFSHEECLPCYRSAATRSLCQPYFDVCARIMSLEGRLRMQRCSCVVQTTRSFKASVLLQRFTGDGASNAGEGRMDPLGAAAFG
jgi:hypothetical protein